MKYNLLVKQVNNMSDILPSTNQLQNNNIDQVFINVELRVWIQFEFSPFLTQVYVSII